MWDGVMKRIESRAPYFRGENYLMAREVYTVVPVVLLIFFTKLPR